MSDAPESLITTGELDDTTEGVGYDLVPLDASLLTNPAVLRAAAGIGIGLAILAWPDRSDRILVLLVGLAFLSLAAVAVWSMVKGRSVHPRTVLATTIQISVGLLLIFAADQSVIVLGRLTGLAIIGLAIFGASIRERRGGGDRWWLVSRTAAGIAVGLLLLSFPEQVVTVATSLAAVGWIILSAVVLIASLDARTSGTSTYSDGIRYVVKWLEDRPKSVDARQDLYDKILYDGPATYRRIVRFFALMSLAAVIASMGVITDSTAVVIGAMLIAPLMTPLMGMAISLVMGWPNRLARSTAVAGAGILLAIGIGVVLGTVAPTLIDTATNSQIIARTSPTTLDLIIAVAAGAAGAYGLSRPDVSDSLPGVAIAISLVPPLTVVGIAYSQGDWIAGHGALLLFTTNMLAILVVGGITFIITGVTPIQRVTGNQQRVRTATASVAVLAVLVVGALLLNGAEVTTNLLEQSRTESTVDTWLEDAPRHTLVQTHISGDDVAAVVVGPSTGIPDLEELADQLQDALDRPVEIDLRLIVEERLTAASGE